MSYNNPNVKEIISIIETDYPEMKDHLHKSYLNLAKYEFYRRHKRKATLDDAQELFNIYQEQWLDYYVFRIPRENQQYRMLAKTIYRPLIHTKRDLTKSARMFLQYKFGKFVECPDRDNYWLDPFINKKGYYDGLTVKINPGHEPMLLFIVDNGLTEEFKEWVIKHKSILPKHRSVRSSSCSIDFSHLAYNGVTDDF